MANVDAAFGLRPVKHLHHSVTPSPNAYSIASGYGSNIFHGSPVKSVGTHKRIQIATDGDLILGIFAGCEYTNAAGERKFSRYWPASTVATEVTAYVYDDPQIIYVVQADEDVVEADIGLIADIVGSGNGDTATGNSTAELDSSDLATGTDGQLKVIEFDPAEDNERGSNYARVYVMIREHELNTTVTGI